MKTATPRRIGRYVRMPKAMRPITASAGTSPIAALPRSTMSRRVSISASSTPTTAIAMRLNSRMRLRWKITGLPSPQPSPKGEGGR